MSTLSNIGEDFSQQTSSTLMDNDSNLSQEGQNVSSPLEVEQTTTTSVSANRDRSDIDAHIFNRSSPSILEGSTVIPSETPPTVDHSSDQTSESGREVAQPTIDPEKKIIDHFKTIPAKETTFDYNGTQILITVKQLEKGEKIGSGQSEGVYRVEIEKPIPLLMAVKRIPIGGNTEKRLQTYLELTALEKIRLSPSPYVVEFYCAVRDPKSYSSICMPYMKMDVEKFYTKMHSLKNIYPNIVNVFLRRCAHDLIMGLKHLKDQGIVHRDVKPTNLLMDSTGRIKLCDFGISGRLDSTEPDFGINVGTKHYLPPKSQKCSIQNDMWATGMSLLEIAKGKHPLANYQPDLVPFVLYSWGIPPMNEIDKDIRDFISMLLEKESESRPKSYEDIIEKTFIRTMSESLSDEENSLFQDVLGENLSLSASDEPPHVTPLDDDFRAKMVNEIGQLDKNLP